MRKSCGGCSYWIKMKGFGDNKSVSGLCERLDLRCPSDHSCQEYKKIPYNKKIEDILFLKETKKYFQRMTQEEFEERYNQVIEK